MLANQPWNFLKFDNELCSGFSHTRGLSILFSERVVQHAVSLFKDGNLDVALKTMGPLLVHEQMHVLERCYPQRFAKLYEEVFGLIHAKVKPNRWLTANQVSNPDALSGDWLIPLQLEGADGQASADGAPIQLWWPRTLLRPGVSTPRLGADFVNLATLVKQTDQGHEVVMTESGLPESRPMKELSPFLDRFPIRTGKDHPNEIAAYLMEQVLLAEVLGTDADRAKMPAMVKSMRDWARTELR